MADPHNADAFDTGQSSLDSLNTDVLEPTGGRKPEKTEKTRRKPEENRDAFEKPLLRKHLGRKCT